MIRAIRHRENKYKLENSSIAWWQGRAIQLSATSATTLVSKTKVVRPLAGSDCFEKDTVFPIYSIQI